MNFFNNLKLKLSESFCNFNNKKNQLKNQTQPKRSGFIMNTQFETLQQLYRNCDQLLSEVDSIEELSRAIENFLKFMNIQQVKNNHFSFKRWSSLIINRLHHFKTSVLPFQIIMFINKCVEFNLIDYREYSLLSKYQNLPDHKELLQYQNQICVSKEDEDVEDNKPIYSKIKKLLQIDNLQYTTQSSIGYSLLTLKGNFVWMDQQSKDIFEIQNLNENEHNFFSFIIDESKKKLQEILGKDNNGNIQILNKFQLHNKITYVIVSKEKLEKVNNFVKKKGIKKIKKMNNKSFFDLYLKCLVSHFKLVKVNFNLNLLTKKFQKLQSVDNTYFQDKTANRIEDQFQSELDIEHFRKSNKNEHYLIQMSTRVANSVPNMIFQKTKKKILLKNFKQFSNFLMFMYCAKNSQKITKFYFKIIYLVMYHFLVLYHLFIDFEFVFVLIFAHLFNHSIQWYYFLTI